MNRKLIPAALLIAPVISLVISLALSTPASAHAPIMGIGGVLGGVLHALLIPEHGLSLVALGLVLGRQQQQVRHTGMLIFLAALACGLTGAALLGEETVAADVLVAAAGILGLLVAAAWMPPLLGLALAAVAGLTIALDSRPEGTSAAEAVTMLIGSGIGAAAALGIVAEASVLARGRALLIAARVAGSWIAAIAILVLALRIVTRMTTG
jgi:urease accessory protein